MWGTVPHLILSRTSFWADSWLSEPWMRLEPMSMQKSPRMVPGAEAVGLVWPRSWRPSEAAPRPSQTMATTGPEVTARCQKRQNWPKGNPACMYVLYLMSEGKKGFEARSE